jgi:hypothetical protein
MRRANTETTSVSKHKYYFDTSALKDLGNRISDENVRNNCFISYLNFTELLNQIETDFHITQKLFQKIIKSKIEITWWSPENMIIGITVPNAVENYSQDLEAVIKLVLKAQDFSHFLNLHKDHKFKKYDYFYFKDYDQHFSYNKSDRKSYLTNLKSFFKSNGTDLETEVWNMTFQMLKEKDGYVKIIESIVRPYYDKLTTKKIINESLPAFAKRYVSSLDIFILFCFYIDTLKTARFEDYAKNDLIDIHHSIYICPEDRKIISNDKIHRTLNNIRKDSCWTLDEFYQKLNIK